MRGRPHTPQEKSPLEPDTRDGGRAHLRALSRVQAAARSTTSTRWRRCFEFEMPDREMLPIVVDIEGGERSTQQQAFREKVLADRGGAEQHIIVIFFMARSFERDRCCGGRGVPRRPASGQARLRAHVELSRGWLSRARGSS